MRLRDFEAAALVERNLAVYVDKASWKAAKRSTIHTASLPRTSPRPASRNENGDSP
jgi:hypothetical protein